MIYNTYGLSNKAIIYTMNANTAQEKLAAKGVNKGNWLVSGSSSEIVQAVLE
jgi:hypothetical protein